MTLKAPFPYFGGKSRVAHEVWHRFGDVQNFVEPFCGSAAVLLARPSTPRIETVNDANCFIANFWRAIAADPSGVAALCDWPINEADLHARHRWLMLSGASLEWRERMKRDPEHFDSQVAAWWVWGACQWIGAGWCDGSHIHGEGRTRDGKLPVLDSSKGVHRPQDGAELSGDESALSLPACRPAGLPDWWEAREPGTHNERRRPQLTNAIGVHSLRNSAEETAAMMWRKRPNLGSHKGVHAVGGGFDGPEEDVWLQAPDLSGSRGAAGRGIHASGMHRKRPQLTGNGAKGVQCKAPVLAWFNQLQQRLRRVRVTCGDWARVCTPAVTSGIGLTGVFLDPPYSAEANRDSDIYAVEDLKVAHLVRAWCLERGGDPKMRIALCGYEGEHDALEGAGWRVHVWRTGGGYANQNQGGQGHANRLRERIWFSPHCLTGQPDLF